MTISINSNAKAKQESVSRSAGGYHGALQTQEPSKASQHLGKAKNGWIGAALLRGRVVQLP